MSVFIKYADYYDLLYTQKNYDAEVNYVDSLIKRFAPNAQSILDLGCGTGNHGFYFAKKNYFVDGVDLSDQMIEIAKSKLKKEALTNINFQQGDIKRLDLHREYDVVVSLFHVMNYLTSNADLYSGFYSATKHVKPGGIFIFDCWYGPAVLTDLPKNGVKRLENDKIKVTRIVEPVIHFNSSVVDVNYEIMIEEKKTHRIEVIKETHSVRYFFRNEIELLLEKLGMEILIVEEWLTSKEAGRNSFGVCFVSQKTDTGKLKIHTV